MPFKAIPIHTLQNLKDEYLRLQDPTEYRFAKQNIEGGWAAWDKLLEDPDASPLIGQWRKELAARLRSDSLRRILEAAQGETRDALAANKYIYEVFSTEDGRKNPIGRPSKEAILKEANKLSTDNRLRDEAYERVLGNAKEEIKEN